MRFKSQSSLNVNEIDIKSSAALWFRPFKKESSPSVDGAFHITAIAFLFPYLMKDFQLFSSLSSALTLY